MGRHKAPGCDHLRLAILLLTEVVAVVVAVFCTGPKPKESQRATHFLSRRLLLGRHSRSCCPAGWCHTSPELNKWARSRTPGLRARKGGAGEQRWHQVKQLAPNTTRCNFHLSHVILGCRHSSQGAVFEHDKTRLAVLEAQHFETFDSPEQAS